MLKLPTGNGQAPAVTADAARAAIEAEKQSRAEQCRAEVDAALQKYHCQAQIIEVRINGQVQQVTLQIVAGD